MSKILEYSLRGLAVYLFILLFAVSLILLLLMEEPDATMIIGFLVAASLIVTLFIKLKADYKSTKTAEVTNARESEKHKFFYDNPQPMWIYEVGSLKFLDVNDAAIAKYGYSRAEFLNITLQEVRPKDEHRSLLEYMDQELKSYETGDVWTHKTRDGKEIIVSLSAHSIDYRGKQARLVIINDITETVAARNDADHTSSFLSNILENLEEIIWVVDREFKLIEFNEKFKQVLKDATGRNIEKGSKVLFDKFPPKTKQFWRKKYLEALNGESLQFEYFFAGVEGNQITNIHMKPGKDKYGKIPFVICSGSNVTSYVNIKNEHKEALKQYELITKSTNDAVWDLDLLDNSLKWGQGIQNRFGYDLKETNLEWWEERVHPEDIERVNESLHQAIMSSKNHWREGYRFKTLKGTYKHVIDQGYIMRDKDGVAYKMIGAIQDIDYLIKSQKEIKKLSLLASKTSNAVIITDKNEQIEWVNNGFTKLSGYTMEEVMGKKPGEVLQGPNTDKETVEYVRKKLASEESVTVEIVNYRKNGEEYWVEMTITPVDYTGDGKVDNYIAIETDITARKRRQQLLEIKNKELQSIAFITAHQLRKPVANLMGLSKLMEQKTDNPADLKQLVPMIVKSCEELDNQLMNIVQNAYNAEKQSEIRDKSESK